MYQLGILFYELLVGVPPFYNENIELLYEIIQKGEYEFPPQISVDAKDLISNLLLLDSNSRYDIKKIKSHKLFLGINWEEVKLQKIDSPLKQALENSTDPKPSQFIPVMFHDQDYLSPSETFNRVKGFSFKK